MPAFKPNVMVDLQDSVGKLFARVAATNTIDLTHDDILMMFVPAEDHYVLKRAREIGNARWHSIGSSVEHARPLGGGRKAKRTVTIHDAGGQHPMLRRKPAWQPSVDLALIEKITSWVTRRIEIGTEFGRGKHVLARLNSRCATPEQVRFFCPGILVLADMLPNTKRYAEKLAAFKAPSTVPALPPGLRAGLN